jgi:hypothetical protein
MNGKGEVAYLHRLREKDNVGDWSPDRGASTAGALNN